MSGESCVRSVIRNLRTAKRSINPFICPETLAIISQPSPSAAAAAAAIPFFSEINLRSLHRILSCDSIPSSTSLNLFNFLLRTPPPSLSFQPDLRSHLILAFRLIQAANFPEAEKLIKSVAVDRIHDHPFPILVEELQSIPSKPRYFAQLFNTILHVYSENRLFSEASMALDHMMANGIGVNEKTCTMHLLALKRCGEVKMSMDFFDRMVESGMPVSVYSLNAVLDGLCRIGEIAMGRELVEEMTRRGTVRPNIFTFNVLIATSAKRWNFDELDSVLRLMEKEAVSFNCDTYKLLIEGFAGSGKAGEAERLLDEMHGKGLRADSHLYNIAIKAYCKSGETESAVSIFDRMTERGMLKNPDTYSALISGLCRAGKMDAVKNYVKEMQKKGIELDNDIVEKVLEGFCREGMVEQMQKFRASIEGKGFAGSATMGLRRKAKQLPKQSKIGRNRSAIRLNEHRARVLSVIDKV